MFHLSMFHFIHQMGELMNSSNLNPSAASTTTAKDPRPANVTWASPYITVSDIDNMVSFYQNAFNFEKKEVVPGEDGTSWHGEMKYKDQLIMLGKAGAYGGTTKSPKMSGIESPMNLYLYCEDVDQFFKHAIQAGAQALAEPQDMFWGDRMCRLKDPEGYLWCFATHIGS